MSKYSLLAIFYLSICLVNQIASSSLHSRLTAIHRAHKQIETIVSKGNSTLQHLEPSVKGFSGEALVRKCYNSTLGSQHVDIFHLPLAEVLRRFVALHYRLFLHKDHKEIRKRLANVLANVRLLGRNVVDCVVNMRKDKLFKPTTLGLNMFSAFSWKEIKSKFSKPMNANRIPSLPPMGSSKPSSGFTGPCISKLSPSLVARLPAAFDWRAKGVVSAVKEQLECGSCYAFSAIGALESAYQIQMGQEKGEKVVREMSEQDIINCYSNEGKDGCGLGYPHEVLNMSVYRGVMLASDRPYKARVEECQTASPLFGRPRSWCLNSGNISDDMFKAIVYHFGPAIVGFNTDDPAFYQLKASPYNRPCAPSSRADHAMLLVGWDEKGNWIVKNSYGPEFGVDGYLVVPANIARGCAMGVFTGVPIFAKTQLMEEVTEDQKQFPKIGFLERLFG